MPDEDNLPVYVCRELKMPFEEAWPRIEHYDKARSRGAREGAAYRIQVWA
jgi:hypothetical protein